MNAISERVDDIPVIVALLLKMHVAELIDQHFSPAWHPVQYCGGAAEIGGEFINNQPVARTRLYKHHEPLRHRRSRNETCSH
ncbi:MAG: hypothetical protein SF339_21040 [Blastocatellia bacterium]|nr:hypothetical protein [Blastocatellia bacterium]